MKNLFKLIGIVALVAVIGFSMAACDNGTGGGKPQTLTYTGTSGGTAYTLKITENTARYAAQSGDDYELTAGSMKSSGTVQNVEGGELTLKPSNADTTFTASVSGSSLTALNGTITWTNNTTADAPGAFTGGNQNADTMKWTTVDASGIFGDNTIKSIAYGNGTFIAGTEYGKKIAYSNDNGATWTEININSVFDDSTDGISVIAYGGGKFIAGSSYGKLAYSMDGVTWIKAYTGAFSYAIESIAWGNDVFVAGGSSGTILYSEDGINWTGGAMGGGISGIKWTNESPFSSSSIINAVAFGNGTFVVGGGKDIYMSREPQLAVTTDGKTWTGIDLSKIFIYDISIVAFGNGKFVAGDGSGAIATSTDGKNWTAVSSPYGYYFNTIAFGNGTFVAGDYNGNIMTSTNGTSWTPVSYGILGKDKYDSSIGNSAIVYGNGTFVAVGNEGKIAYSKVTGTDSNQQITTYTGTSDGETYVLKITGNAANNTAQSGDAYELTSWSKKSTGTVQSAAGGVLTLKPSNAATTFTAAISGKNLTALNGTITWTDNTTDDAPGTFNGGNQNGGNMIWTAGNTDNVFNYTNVAANYTYKTNIETVAYGNGKFIAVDDRGQMAYSSDKGATWTGVADNKFDNHTIYSIAYGNGMFVGGSNDGITYSSDGGVSWTFSEISSFYGSVSAIVYDGSKFVAASYYIFTSTDAKNWTYVRDSNFSASVIAYGNNMFVAGGSKGKMWISTNGTTWTAVADSKLDDDIKSIAYGNNKFIAASNNNVAVSTNGTTWTKIDVSSIFTGGINAIAYGNNKFIVVGYNGKMASSTNGTAWIAENSSFGSGIDNHIRAIAYGSGTFVAVGDGGKIRYSNDGGDDGGTPPTITTTTLPNGTVGTAYSQILTASGDTPITWTRDSGTLPGGLTLSSAGVISGTPTTAGTFTFTVKAANAKGSITKSLTITIVAGGIPTSGGTFTLTGIPSEYNGKYAIFLSDLVDDNFLLIGAQLDYSKEEFTYCEISNGRVSLPMWKCPTDDNDDIIDIEPYSGNDMVTFIIMINASSDYTDDAPALAFFETAVAFSSGNATRSWSQADTIYD